MNVATRSQFDIVDALINDYERTLLELSEGPPVTRDRHRRWFVTGYDAAGAVIRDRRFSSDTGNAVVLDGGIETSEAFGGSEMPIRPYLFFDPPPFSLARPFLFLDPPDHTRLRRLVSRAFTPHRVASMRPMVERLVDELLRPGVLGRDLMDAFAYPLPMRIIMAMLALPVDLEPLIRRWTPPLVGILTADSLRDARERDEARMAQSTLAPALAERVESRRRDLGPDLLSALIEAEDNGDVLNTFEVVATAMLLLLAGHETTANLIGNAVLSLLRHRDQLEAVTHSPALVASAIEETLRHAPPVQLIARTATEDVELAGREIAAGDHVVVLIAAANRDPRRFADPHRFDIGRDAGGHFGFGFGMHHCLGASLARHEAEVALTALLPLLASSRVREPVRWRRGAVIHGPVTLELQPW